MYIDLFVFLRQDFTANSVRFAQGEKREFFAAFALRILTLRKPCIASKLCSIASQAAGAAREGSDIDLIVISGGWKKYNYRERLELLGIASARILEPVQAQGFTPSEVKLKKVMPFWEQIMKEQAIAV